MKESYDPLDRVAEKTLTQGGEIQDDSTYIYQRELDTVKLASANNSVEQLSFVYENAPPFSNANFGVTASDPSKALKLTQGVFAVARDVTGNISSISGAGAQLFTASYDPAGRLAQLLSSFNAQSYCATLSYDGFGRKGVTRA